MKIKKTIALFVLLIVGLSSLAIAQNVGVGVNVNTQTSARTIGQNGQTGNSAEVENQGETAGKTETENENRIADSQENESENMTRAGLGVQARAGMHVSQDAREQRQTRQENRREQRSLVHDFVSARAEIRAEVAQGKLDVKKVSDDLKACKGMNTDDCAGKRVDAKLRVAAVLERAANTTVSLLSETRARIAESNLSNKADLLAQLDSRITSVNSAGTAVSLLSENSTKADIKSAAEQLRTAVHDSKLELRMSAYALVETRLGGVLQQNEHLKAKLDEAISKLNASGTDTSGLHVDLLNTKLDLAAQLHAEAVAAFEKAHNAEIGSRAELMQAATQKLRDSNVALKEARVELRNVVAHVKALHGGTSVLEQNGERLGAEGTMQTSVVASTTTAARVS